MTTTGDMLRLARQRRGFTQQTAAARLGVVQPVLSRFEHSVTEPDEDFLEKAGKAYSVPRNFFDLRDPIYGPPVSVHPMLRGKADITARDVDRITAELNIRLIHLRTFLEGVDFEPTSDLPTLDVEQYGDIEKIASTLRSHWHLPNGPIRNLLQVVERAGIIVGQSTFGGSSISGVTFKISGRPPLVLLNSTHPADRTRFTLAHELGHLVMHRFPTPNMEDEANKFASAFLMPASDMHDAFKGRKITLQLLAALKPEWKVAMQALLMRASQLGHVSGNQSRYLWQQISSHGWRLREPPELDFPSEIPKVLPAILRTHTHELGYSMSELAKMLRIHEPELAELYGQAELPPGKPRLRVVT